MKARLPLDKKTKLKIEEYYRQYAAEQNQQAMRIFIMLACETMIDNYGFGTKRLPEFVDHLLAKMSKLADVYDDSVEFKCRMDLRELGYDFDGQWESWKKRYHEETEPKSKE